MTDKTELKPVAYFSATKEGKIIWSEDCCCEDPVYPRHDDDDSISLAVYSESSKQSLQQEIEQLRNEVKSLKKETVQRVVTQLSAVFVKEGSYSNSDYVHYVALCNDGTMWFREDAAQAWRKLQNVPQPEYQECSQWVSVNERLPEIDTPVLAVVGKKVYALARVEYEEGWLWGIGGNDLSDARNYEADDDYQPTHWMYLPLQPALEGDKP